MNAEIDYWLVLRRQFGAHRVVDDLAEPGLGPFHLVLDGVGGTVLTQALRLLTPEGTAVLYGGAGGPAQVGIGDFAVSGHHARIVGFISEAPVLTKGEDVGIVAQLVAEGRVTPSIGWLEDWQQTPAAFEALAARAFRGKAVLVRDPTGPPPVTQPSD